MSEQEIAAWQQRGVSAETAQTLRRAGVETSAYDGWVRSGITDTRAILTWLDHGFASEAAGAWAAAGFDPESAERWADEQFEAENAARWRNAGFDLRKAKNERARGLSPID
ncbi:MAG: hypothetical protein V2J02_17695 [Pseudomonadales bacterium]|jgi:hypothetical protein|nr:hypothetical protein [Pseudomonadales bacterium]